MIMMPVFERYCDKCGEPSIRLRNVNGRMLCPKCRGLKVEEDEEVGRKAKLRKMWDIR
ncbi:MAG: hypothetical protein KAV48_02375 [Methanomicrobia archaeon]|nr:hypothetical protein [Methanomicrobia archaeon]